jgi:hypothetical protein
MLVESAGIAHRRSEQYHTIRRGEGIIPFVGPKPMEIRRGYGFVNRADQPTEPRKDRAAVRPSAAVHRFNLAALLLVSGMIPAWIYFTYVVAHSPGFGATGYWFVPLALIVATMAISRLSGRTWFGIALAMLLAVIVLFGALSLVAIYSSHQ